MEPNSRSIRHIYKKEREPMQIIYEIKNSKPIPKVVPETSESQNELRELVHHLTIKNPSMTFASEYAKYEESKGSMFDALSEQEIERIARAVNNTSELFKEVENQSDGGEPEINLLRLLERLLYLVAQM